MCLQERKAFIIVSLMKTIYWRKLRIKLNKQESVLRKETNAAKNVS